MKYIFFTGGFSDEKKRYYSKEYPRKCLALVSFDEKQAVKPIKYGADIFFEKFHK